MTMKHTLPRHWFIALLASIGVASVLENAMELRLHNALTSTGNMAIFEWLYVVTGLILSVFAIISVWCFITHEPG